VSSVFFLRVSVLKSSFRPFFGQALENRGPPSIPCTNFNRRRRKTPPKSTRIGEELDVPPDNQPSYLGTPAIGWLPLTQARH
jgi:hypothetical protein